MKHLIYLLFFCIAAPLALQAQSTLSGTITNTNKLPLVNATISLNDKNQTSTNSKGQYYFKDLTPGEYTLYISHIASEKRQDKILIKAGDNFFNSQIRLKSTNIDEVYVTAQEGKSLSTSSIITKDAMQLLQPSSFADLLELLPGGRAQDPKLGSYNAIKIREVNLQNKTITDPAYDMSSLGVAIYMDGAPINNNANMQSVSGFTTSGNTEQVSSFNRGLDLRTLGTDDIEKVTIIRGIPSVSYGDLTSGLVLIERKKGEAPFSLRAKTDGFGKLFSISKGFTRQDSLFINFDLGYLRAAQNPTNSFENFNRLSGSLRIDKTWRQYHAYNLRSALDYNTTLDNRKTDPDNSLDVTDKFYSRNQSYALTNTFGIKFQDISWIDKLELTSKIAFQNDIIEEDKWIQSRSATILVNSLEQGSHEAKFLTPAYVSNMYVQGRPFTAFHKIESNHHFNINKVKNKLLFGLESNYSKNFGLGQEYDLDYPAIVNSTNTARPRAFKNIPGFHTLSAYLENNIAYNFWNTKFEGSLGVRASSMTSLSESYSMHSKVYTEPRANIRWHMPTFQVANKDLLLTFGGGFGQMMKYPTINHFYPPLDYTDVVELNFFHNNPAYRIAQAYTNIVDPTNYAIVPARNTKYEINTDVDYQGIRLSFTWFKERMSDAFRPTNAITTIPYRKYDNTSLDPTNLTQKPSLTDFTYTDAKEHYVYGQTNNGSQIWKDGLEFQFVTDRLKGINTRFTLQGAYIKNTYKNSVPIIALDRTLNHDNKVRQVSATYHDDSGYLRESFNTNLTVDTDLPTLGINLSASFQALWLYSSQQMRRNGTPISYQFVNEAEKPFTEASLLDPTLKQLVITYNESNYVKFKEPLDLQINIKASKRYKKFMKASVFVNRLISYRPNYTSALGTSVSRELLAPYFGMELSFNF